jgi:RNA polymerase sigma-70 factor, ECF subfamily
VAQRPGSEAFEPVLAAAQQGSAWAYTSLWNEYAPAVAGFLRARGSREPDDLTSEVFLAVFERLPTFAGAEAEFRSFVFSVAYRRLVDELRMRARRGIHEQWRPGSDERRSPSAEDDAHTRLGDARALALLDILPPDQRDVMVLRVVADLTIEQIAEVLGKREGAVKALQRRALENLRKKVSPTRTPVGLSSDSAE